MSIPLDRLYHYIESVAREIHGDTVIYRFWPHGSKKIEDLKIASVLRHPHDILTGIQLICHDQEPLVYDLYAKINRFGPAFYKPEFRSQFDLLTEDDLKLYKVNLRDSPNNIYDKCLLLHSELQSSEVEKYAKDQFIPVYYWSHALIARDWYRYAQHLKQCRTDNVNKFLVYNRSWSGTREYRLKLSDLLIDYQLVDQCRTSFSFVDHDTDIHYSQYKLANPSWTPVNKFESYYQSNNYPAHSSADFDISDYQSTDIEIVLETLFDDSRIHLTEKSLRPMALGQPFILAGPAGSLKYLKNYGFKTFDSAIDESYDDISDPSQRLIAIAELMSTIHKMPQAQYQELLYKLNKISEYNKNYFFSDTFTNIIKHELFENLSSGIDQLLSTNTYKRFLTLQSNLKNNSAYTQWRNINLPQHLVQCADEVYQKTLNLSHQ